MRQTSKKKKPTTHPCPRCGHTLRRNGTTPGGKQRWRCGGDKRNQAGCNYGTTDPSSPPRDQRGDTKTPNKNTQFKRKLSGIKRFVITAAQNGTPVHEGFLKALETYCRHNNAELVVVPIRYRNPTSRWSLSQANAETWAPEVAKYLYNQRKKLCPNLVLLGDIKTVPTAVNPLSGFESITHGESGILAHTKLQLTTIPTPQGTYPKLLTTTGAVTVPNYTDSKAGKKGEFHHTLGACAVDIVGSKFFVRQINADKKIGDFIDLDKRYHPNVREGVNGVLDAQPALGIAFGDTHRAQMDPTVEKVTFGKGGIVDTLNPEYLCFHDLHDGTAINHHERKNPFAQVKLRHQDAHRAEQEVRDDVAWLQKVTKGRKAVVIPSNHDDFLSRWLADVDWRRDPDNAEFYLESALEMVRGVKEGTAPEVFKYWVNRLNDGKEDIRCLSRGESFTLGDVEMSLHGDMGPNGARGSRMNIRRIGVKTIIGHSHSPGIEEGCYQAGTSSKLQLGYNQGPSSWLHTHVVVYANGKRCLLSIIDGKWRF